jgi:hypothetical protein
VLCVALALLAAAPAGAEVIDRVLATVGGQVVTLSDVRAAGVFGLLPAGTRADSVPDVLAYLVDRQLMLSEVDRYSAPDPDRAAVERRLAQVRAAFASRADYERALARTAMTEFRLSSLIADDLRIVTYLDQRFGGAAQPTPEEVQRYYRDHPDAFTRDGRLRPFDEVQPQAQAALTAERRLALIADWLDRLRRRADVTLASPPAR